MPNPCCVKSDVKDMCECYCCCCIFDDNSDSKRCICCVCESPKANTACNCEISCQRTQGFGSGSKSDGKCCKL